MGIMSLGICLSFADFLVGLLLRLCPAERLPLPLGEVAERSKDGEGLGVYLASYGISSTGVSFSK